MVVVPRARYNKRPHEELGRSCTRKRLPKTAVFAGFQPRWTSAEHVDDPGETKPGIPPTWLDLNHGQGMDAASNDDRHNTAAPRTCRANFDRGYVGQSLAFSRSRVSRVERGRILVSERQFFITEGGAFPMNGRGTRSRMSVPHSVAVATKSATHRRPTTHWIRSTPVNPRVQSTRPSCPWIQSVQRGKHGGPISLHIHDRPSFFRRPIEPVIKSTDF